MELETLIKSESCRKILQFFHENPASIDTARGVATWTNQDVEKTKNALEKLADLGFLVSHKVTSTIGYSYTRDQKKISKIRKLLKKQ